MIYQDKVISYKGRIVFGKRLIPYFNRVPRDYKADEACFIFLNKGEFSLRAQNKQVRLNKENAVLGKCANYLYETDKEQRNSSDYLDLIIVLLYPSIVEEIFEFDLIDSNFQTNYNIKQVSVDKLLENFKESINILFENPELVDENIIKHKLKEFILILSKSQNAPSHLDFLSALFQPIDVQFKTIVKNNIYANLSLEEMAFLCHLSLSSFNRKFRQVYSENPKKYLISKKLEKASELLKHTNTRISDIAFDVGFDSIATFNRNFTKQNGKSPSKYRSAYIDKFLK
ncbi:MAG: helix-turn-helix transcriptional regulator [Cytophagales bacterium]